MAYADYSDLMDLTEDLLSKLAFELTGGYVIQFHQETTPEEEKKLIQIDFSRPWKRLPMMETLRERVEQSKPSLAQEKQKLLEELQKETTAEERKVKIPILLKAIEFT
jgi:lysyl-tRNA synthetase class 2